jgi:UDP-N-acetylmuramoyl-tripeptide--D-alanyl-D-alanine ligase
VIKLPLINIANIIQPINLVNVNPIISRVRNDITKLGNDTLVFHLNKDIEMNTKDILKYKNCYIVTDQPVLNEENIDLDRFIFVLNINKAYQSFVDYYRSLFNIPVVAITGTCGKTSTKEIVRQVLEHEFKRFEFKIGMLI